MKTIILNAIALCILIVGVMSCDRPQCTNKNPIFEKNQPDSKIYKDELVKQLKTIDQTKLTYWLQKYEKNDGKEYLYFFIQGNDLCAIIVLTVNQWNRLENLREKKGVGYRGAEFTNLKFDILQDSSKTEFIYKGFSRLID